MGCNVPPEGMRRHNLRFTTESHFRIAPDDRTVPVEVRPVAVPAGGAVVGLGSVVVGFAVAGEVEEFVSYRRRRVEGGEVVGEALPVGLGGEGWVVGGVGAVEQAEFDFGL